MDIVVAIVDVAISFLFSTCTILHRAFISEIHRCPAPCTSLSSFHSKNLGAYLVSLHDHPIFYPCDVDSVLNDLRALAHPPLEVTFFSAPERKSNVIPFAPPPLHLRRLDLHNISSFCPSDLPSVVVSHLLTTPMTAEEWQLPKITHVQLVRLGCVF